MLNYVNIIKRHFPLEKEIIIKDFTYNNCKLDNNQLQVLESQNNALVIAGAGSGKTLTIMAKVKYLIENNFCLPEQILIISFTNASVNDILKKINFNVNVLTFHKLAMQILEKNNIKFNLCNENLLKYIINEYLETCSTSEQKMILKFLKFKDTYLKFKKSNYYKCLNNLIYSFINLYKTNNLHLNSILNQIFTKNQKEILLIIFKIYRLYIIEKQSSNLLDFDDLIIEATKIVKNTHLNYKYIIIDEFQDTSEIRLNLIKEIFLKTNSKLTVVGDDWQSIYHFSGCNMNIFLNFTNIFSNTQIIKLQNTYRNSQELINIASRFITKNSLQIKKELFANKHSNKPIILVPNNNKKRTLKKMLDTLIINQKEIMILARNNNDIYNYIDNNFQLNNNTLLYKNIEIKYYTIHKAKGLEANIVILLNCNNEFLGFPNKIENSILINKIFPDTEIKYAEERRLFYVAITRCRDRTYLVYDKKNPSLFIKEIKKIIKKFLHRIDYFF